jgi:predicted dehydrogenase
MKMNVAILGAGTIVPDFLEAAAQIPEFHIYAIYGREKSLEKLRTFQENYGIDRIYHDYDALLSDGQVDVVYVALPNHLHYEFAKKAIAHRKHVIVEKPFVCTYAQAEELFQSAREQQVVVFEAISNQYLPNYKKTRELIGQIGPVKIVELNFSQYSRRYDQFKEGIVLPVFDPRQAGGTLMDLNIYNVHYVVGLFGKPDAVHYYANIEKDIDTSGILIMEYPDFQCVCIGAKDCRALSGVNIQGEKGYIHSDDKANSYDAFSVSTNGADAEVFSLNAGMPRLYYELRAFADMAGSEDWESINRCADHTLAVQEILDVARKQVGLDF